MQLEQARRAIFFTLLILASVYAPQIKAQRIKDLPRVDKFLVYTDSLRIIFDRHDSTKTTQTRYLKYGLYKWRNSKEFEPKYYRQSSTPLTSVDSNSIWFDTNTNRLKYLDKKSSSWKILDSLKRTHIDPSGIYTKKGAFDKLMVDTLKVGGQIEIVNNTQISGLNATKTYKQNTDPSISNPMNTGDLWINTASSDRFATYYWTGAAWTSYLPGIWDAPSGSGLLLNQNYMGHYSGGSFQTYIRDNGYFYFKGDVNNYISWQGDTLKIKGKITALNSNDFGTATIFRQATQPVSGMEMNDVWFDSDDGDKPYVYYSGSWIPAYTTIDGGYLKTGVIDASLAKIKNMVADSIKSGVFTGLTFQTANVGNARVRINGSNNRIEWVKADNTVGSYLDQSGGNMVLSGKLNMTSSDTITGGVIRTAASGQRAVLTGTGLTFYDATTGSGSIYAETGVLAVTANLAMGTNLGIEGGGGNSSWNLGEGSGLAHNNNAAGTHYYSYLGSTYLEFGSGASAFGTADVNLYRGGANILKTDDTFNAVGGLQLNGAAVATQSWVTSQGYLTSQNWTATAVSAIGGSLTNTAGTLSVTGYNPSNWDTAFGWGNHASAGYAKGTFFPIEGDKFVKYNHSTGQLVGTAYNESSFLTSLPSHNNSAHSETYLTAATQGWQATKIATLTTNDFDITTGNLSIDYTNGQAASASQKGFLTAADWTAFNSKVSTSAMPVYTQNDLDVLPTGAKNGDYYDSLGKTWIYINGWIQLR